MFRSRCIAILLFLSLILPGCAKKKDKAAESGSAFPSGIAAYTWGVISRESTIRVLFAMPVITDSAALNVALKKSPLTIKPAIKGTAIWSSATTFEFRPAEPLKAGVEHKASMSLVGLPVPKDAPAQFEFFFTGMKQSFDLTTEGLRSKSSDNLKVQQYLGMIVTADVDLNPSIEKMVTAEQQGKKCNIIWEHNPNRRHHRFIIDSIARGDESSVVVMAWTGKPIEVDKTGKDSIVIPPLQQFTITSVRAVQGAETYVEIRFSDPLDKNQDLAGDIRTSKNDLRFAIEENVIKVYSRSGWSGDYAITVEKNVKNVMKLPLSAKWESSVTFEPITPQVKFIGSGTIIPTTQGQTIPIEAVNLKAVIVEAMQVYEGTMPQFLQQNDLAGSNELKRVGRIIWKKVVPIDPAGEHTNQWSKYGLDVSPLVANFPGGMYRIKLSFKRHHVIYQCSDTAAAPADESFDLAAENDQEEQTSESSSWDSYEGSYNEDGEYIGNNNYNDRLDPCKEAYYRNISGHDISVSRNVLISDIGIIAKKGQTDSVYITVTDIKSAQPLSGAQVSLLDYQEQQLAQGKTDKNGMLVLSSPHTPFLVIASSGSQKGYLRLEGTAALSVSHFDVSGEAVQKGIKGMLYGERGVWRPGDTLFLTFILHDPDKRLPENHPVQFTLTDSRRREVVTLRSHQSINGFYSFRVPTDFSAPTGMWTAAVRVGGAVFETPVSIETVMPNRLKIKLDFGKTFLAKNDALSATLSSQWLHGAPAGNMRADVKLTLSSSSTSFSRFSDYVFDDPAKTFAPEDVEVFEGDLDENGTTKVDVTVNAANLSPGALMAHFTTRVFEPGGGFSVDRFSLPYHPYSRYIGIKVPKGDKARGMLLTDTTHTIGIVAVKPDGTPAPDTKVLARLYQINWRWWWEKGAESLGDYNGTSSYSAGITDTIDVKNGQGSWNIKVKYPEWGRYLISVTDLDGNHTTGKIVYIDWPGWAGRAQKDTKAGANVMSFTSDKSEYAVGEKATITIPSAQKGRGLVSIENGSRVLKQEWISGDGESVQYQFNVTEEMVPNVYVSITYLQPHLASGNDVPLRTYGIIPVKVVNPATQLAPKIEMPEVLLPLENATVSVAETNGKPMTYTVAVVDEGLLDLTRFKTPDPWSFFFKREALGIKTWDLFDMVAGAYGATLERLLTIGGDDDGADKGKKRANRFPPMVRYYGPFELNAKATNRHEIPMPNYIGSVRVMVVAAQNGAFGSVDKTVPVRKPLMVLATLPRVLSLQEKIDLPVSIFGLDPKIREVTVTIKAEGPLAIEGETKKTVTIKSPGDELVSFTAKALGETGVAHVTVKATASGEKAEQEIEIDIRNPSEPVTEVIAESLKPKQQWQRKVALPGIAGSNSAILEVTSIPPINLHKRLSYLIQYPHGCIEQTTSSVFPQLYLDKLLPLSKDEKVRIEGNIKAGIERIKTFQAPDGGFGYWPGDPHSSEWGSNYAGHFLLEAQKAGYTVPSGMMQQWVYYQQAKSREWVAGSDNGGLMQSYRLYTLALSGNADLGAMNRLREQKLVNTAEQWRLAAGYELAGQKLIAQDMAKSLSTNVGKYREMSNTFGSDLRDMAMVLEAVAILNLTDRFGKLVTDISSRLNNEEWYSTQETAYSLTALAKILGMSDQQSDVSVSVAWNGGKKQTATSNKPVLQVPFDIGEETEGDLSITSGSGTMLFARLILTGTPEIGHEESASNGLSLSVKYESLTGEAVEDLGTIEQGTDIVAVVSVTNTTDRHAEEIALSHLVPSGFEIHNHRLSPNKTTVDKYEYQDIRDDRVYTYFDLRSQESRTFRVLCNASYCGKFYLPAVSVEAMYDATINGREKGQWIEIVEPGRN